MPTKIIGAFDIAQNNSSIAGRQKNKIYKKLKDHYASEIRERTVGDISYIQGYAKYFDYRIAIYRVANDGSYVEKRQNSRRFLIPHKDKAIEKVVHTYIKTFYNKFGKIISLIKKEVVTIDGKVLK